MPLLLFSTPPVFTPPPPVAGVIVAGAAPSRPRPSSGSPHPVVVELYNRLPEFHRDIDDGSLLQFLSVVGDYMGSIFDTLDLLLPTDMWASDLADATAADPRWLPYMAQLAGVDISHISSVPAQRAAIDGGASGRQAGTDGALRAAVRSLLSGTQWVAIARNVSGDPMHLAVQTYAKETPDSSAVLAAISAAKAKVAGAQIDYQVLTGAVYEVLESYYPVSYAQLSSTFLTYDVMTAWTPV